MAFLLHEKQLIVGLVRGQKANAREVETETVDGTHLEHSMLTGVVVVFDPAREGAIEGGEVRQVETTR